MEVREVNGNEIQPAGSGKGLNGGAKLADDFDTFLNLLVTQLKNQDPLEPMKSQEFTNQLVQFSGVEQAIATNDKLDNLIDLQSGNRAATAVSYIGREIEAEGDQVMLQDGSARLAYDLEDNANAAVIEIASSDGSVVRQLEVPTSAGRHEITWDGTDANGNQLADGAYSMTLAAVDGDNQTVKGSTTTFGTVTGFEMREDGVVLNVGEAEFGLDQVKSVKETGGEAA